MRIIRAKAKGKKVTLEAPEEPRQAEVVDLMERLRRSLAGKASGKARGPGRKATTVSGKAARALTRRIS
jgi:DNA end-binding protein Ku